ncbi:MAG TPA: neutral/alkaline non-lysosomal ceramidase N-terminal domain-containing protein [Steroidobacteraceae bacterium]|nr:neutral/alkaline non-lysosomal ceramidase N-terminal domain-containing protein [Steroidobacteraceae bacterium]
MKTASIAALMALSLAALPPAACALSVGAARVDITPGPTSLPKGFEGINDPIFVRAIVIDDGRTRAALVTVDAGAISTQTWSQVSQRAQSDLKIPSAQLLLTATHTHSVPFGNAPDLAQHVLTAISKAAAQLEPARMRYGTGVSYINVNRNIIDPKTHRWWEGPNYEGPSDKTVAVLRFETPAGRPIAVYYNYAVHGVLNGQLDQISGDIPGATSRYLEDSLDEGAVAVWSTGASGDQNPIYFQQTYDLREIRIKDYAARGIDISNAMPPGGQGLNKHDPKVAKLMNQQRQMTVSMGQMLGEEVLHVMRSGLERPMLTEQIAGAQKIVTCPGRKRTDSGRAGYPGTYVDADPIPIRLSLLRLGNVAIAGVNAEVFTTIAQRLKLESPVKNTMMATLTNGAAPSGYIPNDAAFGYDTFEVVSSNLKPGCAETAIVDGLLDLMGATH